MASNNTVLLQGNMTKPEVRTTGTGKSITSTRMVIKTYGDKEDMWVTVKMWGALGENLMASWPDDKNTMRVDVKGRLTEEKWTGQDGNEKSQMVITADTVAVLLDWQTVGGVRYQGDGSVQESNTYNSGISAAKEILNATEKTPEPVARTNYAPDEAPF